MGNKRSYFPCWLLLVICTHRAWGQDPIPIMELYEPETNNIISNSGCKDGLLNDDHHFTVRGKVNKNGANSDAFKDTNLYLQAVTDSSTKAWASQCRPDLTICGSNLNSNCYCERKDANGDYHLVMTIMVKSMYFGGKLMLSWNDARSPFNSPILSNIVDYYPDLCCVPAEIGQQYTINSTANVSSSAKIVWQFDNGTILYSSSIQNPNQFPNLYFGTRTQLKILNVIKGEHQQIYQQRVDEVIVYSCELPVYKQASTSTCENVILFGNKIRTKCITAEVFPQAKCHFTLQNEGINRRTIRDETVYITYTHIDPQSRGNEYYSTSCTLQYPVDGLRPGAWTVQVTMYPDLARVSLAQGTVGQTDNALLLSVPTLSIDSTTCPKSLAGEGDTNVRQGYIRRGERASCQCTRAHAGNPPGTIGWSSAHEGSFDILSQSTDSATIRINSIDNFTCQSKSVLDGSHSMTYIPSYAYGPNSASLTFQRPGPIYLCPNQQTNIDITCQVPVNNFSPAILFTTIDVNSNNLVTKVAVHTAQSISVNYTFTTSGQHTFTCRVENAIFIDISSEAPAKAIQVYAPPNSPPSLQAMGSSVIRVNSETWVKIGSDISVSCLAGEGAFPLVKSVNVTCGQMTSSSGQLSLTRVSGDGITCQCDVDHDTKDPCNGLNLKKEMTIQTAYGPNEVSISFADDQLRSLPNSPLDLCSSEGLDLTLICAVKQSDVRPGLTNSSFTLTKPTKFTTQQTYYDVSGGHYTLVTGLKVNSKGSHNLVCEARNLKFPDIKKVQSLTIEVRVPPNRPPSVQVTGQYVIKDNLETWVKQGSDMIISCLAGEAYPLVKSVTVTCGQETSLNGQLAVSAVSGDNMRCQCSVDHETKVPCNGLNLNKEITIQTAYGPNEVSMSFADDQLRSLQNSPLNLCSSESLDFTVICAVKQSDVRPALTNSSFTLTKPTTFITQQTYFDVSRGHYRLVNGLKVNSKGRHNLVCEARNPKFPAIKQVQSTTIEVRVPPNRPPSVQVTGQYVIKDNLETWVKQGSYMNVSCLAGEAYPLVNSVNVTCGQETSLSGQLAVSAVSGDNMRCQCSVDHQTKVPCNSLNLNKELTIQTAYGPNEVSISFADDELRSLPNSPLNLCSSESLDLTVICAVDQSDVRPGLTNSSFTLTKPTTITTQQTYFDISDVGVYRSVNKLKVTSEGSHTLVCEAGNPKFSEIKQTQSMILDVREPPSEPPKISARSTQNGDILVEGDDVLVTCSVSGGYPSVQSVTLSCGQDRSTTNKGTSAILILNKVELSYSNKHCTCQAAHVTGCYDLIGDLPLIIFSNNSTKAGRNEDASPNTPAELAGIVIGSIVGMLVLAAVIALIVFFFRREKAKREKRNNDRDYDTIERPPAPDQRYQNVRPRDPTYETIKHVDHPKEENVNNKTENIDLNDLEAVADDAHVYNEINDSEESTKQDTEANSRKDETEPTEPNPYTEILD